MGDLRSNKRRRSSVKDLVTHQPGLQALILDNGAHTIKVGYARNDQPHSVPNCIMKAKSERKRLFVGKQIEECRDCSGLYFLLPCERGYITKWEVQKPVWDHIFSRQVCPIDDNPVVLTQPLFNFKSIQDCIDEIFFEEYEVPSLFRCTPSDLAYLNYAKTSKSDFCLLVDSGYSFTHIVPYIRGKKFLQAIKRLNVGGKLLTNHLKDIISYRQYNVMEETYVINQVKEDTGYVCMDVKEELKNAAKRDNGITKNYVLPDFNQIRRGYIQDSSTNDQLLDDNYQVLRLCNERFVVPEILFHPSDIGMKSMGIAEAVVKSIRSCPKETQRFLSKHIVITGGNCNFPGFKERMFKELRSLLPVAWEVKIYQPEDPVLYAWRGGSQLLKNQNFRSSLVTKKDYDELGSSIIQERFHNFLMDDSQVVVDNEQVRNNEECFQYLPKLSGATIFGKHDPEIEDEEPVDETQTMVEETIDDEPNGPTWTDNPELFPFGTKSYL